MDKVESELDPSLCIAEKPRQPSLEMSLKYDFRQN
jgi:hypothetical protein